MSPIQDHPLRYSLANELHARPFPTLDAPCRAAYLAIKAAENAVGRDRSADVIHLKKLLDHYAAPYPEEGATHYFGQIGRHLLKWESHTEFVTYTIFGEGSAKEPFDAGTFAMFPEEWLATAPGLRITSALLRVEQQSGDAGITEKVAEWFVPESVAVSRVLDDDAVIAADFRIDPAGHEFMMRRFDPAMRTVASTKERLDAMADRAIRASDLLRTRVDVERSAENKALLESMDRRADLQLRLQKTVEGLSIVAISYYAVNLASNVALPFASELGLGDKTMKAVLTPLVIGLVWLMVRQIRKALD